MYSSVMSATDNEVVNQTRTPSGSETDIQPVKTSPSSGESWEQAWNNLYRPLNVARDESTESYKAHPVPPAQDLQPGPKSTFFSVLGASSYNQHVCIIRLGTRQR